MQDRLNTRQGKYKAREMQDKAARGVQPVKGKANARQVGGNAVSRESHAVCPLTDARLLPLSLSCSDSLIHTFGARLFKNCSDSIIHTFGAGLFVCYILLHFSLAPVANAVIS